MTSKSLKFLVKKQNGADVSAKAIKAGLADAKRLQENKLFC